MAALASCATPPNRSAQLDCSDCDLLLVSIDTLRADHLGCYGYSRPTSPNIDALAASGMRFGSAYSASYHTAESHMSMFTSTFPSVHRVGNTTDASQARSLPSSIQTLTEQLAAAGFSAAGFHGGGNVSAPYGFARGFGSYKATFSDVGPALSWLSSPEPRNARRFFLFFHTYRPHDPYLPDEPYNELWDRDYPGAMFWRKADFEKALPDESFGAKRTLFWSRVDPSSAADRAKLEALYDGEIRQTDDEIGRLLRAVAALGRRVLVVLVSDHGEEFFEHGKNLHDQVFEEHLHVPWIVRHPDGVGAGSVVPGRVSLIQLAPTLLDLLGVPPLPTGQGRSLRSRMAGVDESGLRSAVLAEKVVDESADPGVRPPLKQALLLDDWKLIRYPEGRSSLFLLRDDPSERIDQATTHASVLTELERTLERANLANASLSKKLGSAGAALPAQLSPEEIESLRALGYLH